MKIAENWPSFWLVGEQGIWVDVCNVCFVCLLSISDERVGGGE
jgi:hypothetical protein